MEVNGMKTNILNIGKILNKWTSILKLQDWDITVKLMQPKWKKSGDIKISLENRQALLLINKKPRCENLDELVIHELLHLKLWGMDQMIEDSLSILYGGKMSKKKEFAYTQFMTLLESTVQDLTKGYLIASGSKRPFSLNGLKEQIPEI